jgi:hypothetical protein
MKTKQSIYELEQSILKLLQDKYLDIDGSIKPIEELYREEDLTVMMDETVRKLIYDVEFDIEKYDRIIALYHQA